MCFQKDDVEVLMALPLAWVVAECVFKKMTWRCEVNLSAKPSYTKKKLDGHLLTEVDSLPG